MLAVQAVCSELVSGAGAAISLLNREKTGNFRRITPQYARSGLLTDWYNWSFRSNSLNIGTGNLFSGTGNLIRGTGNYLGGSGNRPTVRRSFKLGGRNRL